MMEKEIFRRQTALAGQVAKLKKLPLYCTNLMLNARNEINFTISGDSGNY